MWGTSRQTEKLYNDISKSLHPHIKDAKQKLPFEVPPLPKTGEIRFLAKHYYNEGVKSSIHFIYMLPCHTGRLAKKAKDAISGALEAPAEQASSAK